MKLFSILIFLGFCLSAAATAEDSTMHSLQITITAISRSGEITVKLRNGSEGPIKIWRESNAWGAARWRVLRVREGQLETFFQNPNQRFTRNMPISDEIAPGRDIERKLDLNGGNWCGFRHCSSYNERGLGGREASFEPGDVIIVTYDVPRSNEASDMAVWYGVIASMATVQ